MARLRTRAPGFEDVGLVHVGDLVEREGREHPLQLEAEQIERVGALLGIERADPAPAVAARFGQAGLELRHHVGVALPLGEQVAPARQALVRDGQDRLVGHRGQQGPLRGFRGLEEEVVEFDHVAVHVDDPTLSGIGHGDSSRSGWPAAQA